MSRVIIYGEMGDVEREIIWEKGECKRKVNGNCYNDKNLEGMGKRCRKCRECEYYIEEDCKIGRRVYGNERNLENTIERVRI